MNRGIAIVGMVVSMILALVGFAHALLTLIYMKDLLSLLYSMPAAVIGTTLLCYFAHEFLLTFTGFVELMDAMHGSQHMDWDRIEFEHQSAIERANKLQALRMQRYG